MALLTARPQPVEIDLARAVLLVVDMQNTFADKSNRLHVCDDDAELLDRVVANNGRLLGAARTAGLKVVYLQMGYRADMADAGGAETPGRAKRMARTGTDKSAAASLAEGTWGFEIIDELKPQPGEVVLRKTKFSGFVDTPLDSLLRANAIKYLLVTGIATNVCVESTIRSAYFLDYWPILIADAAGQAGPSLLQEATVHNVANYFGWVATTEDVIALVTG
jgi:ureidoacrylate peracid hydrolase